MESDAIDYIKAEGQIKINFRGRYLFLFGEDTLDLFDVEMVKPMIRHPVTKEVFESSTLKYIQAYAECYKLTNDVDVSPKLLKTLYHWYNRNRKAGISADVLNNDTETKSAYNIVRHYLTITDFHSHFHDFNPHDSNQERYERDLAEKALKLNGRIGTWLLRHSSYNRPNDKEKADKLKRYGIKYYAISFINRIGLIDHELIQYRVGYGWKNRNKWYPTFIDCLEAVLISLGLPYERRIDDYISDE